MTDPGFVRGRKVALASAVLILCLGWGSLVRPWQDAYPALFTRADRWGRPFLRRGLRVMRLRRMSWGKVSHGGSRLRVELPTGPGSGGCPAERSHGGPPVGY